MAHAVLTLTDDELTTVINIIASLTPSSYKDFREQSVIAKVRSVLDDLEDKDTFHLRVVSVR